MVLIYVGFLIFYEIFDSPLEAVEVVKGLIFVSSNLLCFIAEFEN